MTIESYTQRFRHLRVASGPEGFRPHKPRMLLAVMALAEAGGLIQNRILFAPPLLERYRRFFDATRREGDRPSPYYPFFHLRGDGFWHLKPFPGRGPVLAAMRSARCAADIEQNISHALLDEELYALVLDAVSREVLRSVIVAHWFPYTGEGLLGVIDEERSAAQYESRIRGLEQARDAPVEPELYADKARTSAFRRAVVEAYDYRCAASGWRIILPDGQVIVEAAHLIPFSASGDDDPRNGIALTPSYHWALDRQLIAPGPDLRWHVAKVLDPRLRDNEVLRELEGRPVLLPPRPRHRPRPDALAYRLEHLRKD
jgi:putative restriction endonuclease